MAYSEPMLESHGVCTAERRLIGEVLRLQVPTQHGATIRLCIVIRGSRLIDGSAQGTNRVWNYMIR
jgi:hypothetical protein